MTTNYFGKHASLSEWLTSARLPQGESLIREDATKRRRLEVLSARLGLPIVDVASFSGGEIQEPSAAFAAFATEADGKLYAVRAVPMGKVATVLRQRKQTVPTLVEWLITQGAASEEYTLNFELHIDPEQAAIFVVDEQRVSGEAIAGGILALNRGTSDQAIAGFVWERGVLAIDTSDDALREFVSHAIELVRVRDAGALQAVASEVDARTSAEFIMGYYEVIFSRDSGVRFIDFNRSLSGAGMSVEVRRPSVSGAVTGRPASAGVGIGRVRVVAEAEVASTSIKADEVLVCEFTSPEFVPLIRECAAVVTDVGGVLSHAAIVCRELRKPCVVGTQDGTRLLRTGDQVEVDGSRGIVTIARRVTARD